MKIKIVPTNAKVIEEALAAVNGMATEHTFVTFDGIEGIATRAEKALSAIGLRGDYRQGALVVAESGEELPSAYKYVAKSTLIKIVRGKAEWFLVEINAEKLRPKSMPIWHVWLEQDQVDFACQNLINKNNIKVYKD
jgi:hypothetical protein